MGEYTAVRGKRRKKRRVRYHFELVLRAGGLVFVFMFYRYMKTTSLEDVLSKSGSIVVPAGVSDPVVQDDSGNQTASNLPDELVNPVPEGQPAGEEYFDSSLFIGDSIIYGLGTYNIIPEAKVYSTLRMNVSNAATETVTADGGERSVIEAVREESFENIYVMLGTNSLSYMSVSDIYLDFTKFADKLKSVSGDARVFIISVTPVTRGKEESIESPVSNQNIDEYNSLLLEYADRYGMLYLDLNSYLKGSDGYLPSELAENDGMHLKSDTYGIIKDYLLTHTYTTELVGSALEDSADGASE